MTALAEVAKAAVVPEKVGAYRVVAHFDFLGLGERVLMLAVSCSTGLEYATALVSPFEANPPEWYAGRYYGGRSARENLRGATRNFYERIDVRIRSAD